MQDGSLTGWYVGFAVTAGVVLIVVALLAVVLLLVRRIGVRALRVSLILDDIQRRSRPLTGIRDVGARLDDAATAARGVPGGQAGGASA